MLPDLRQLLPNLEVVWALPLALLFEAAQAAVLIAKAAVVASKMARIFGLLFQMPPFLKSTKNKKLSCMNFRAKNRPDLDRTIGPPSTSRIIDVSLSAVRVHAS